MRYSKVLIEVEGAKVPVQLHRDEYAGGGRAVWAMVGERFEPLSVWTGRTEELPRGAWYGKRGEDSGVMRALLRVGAVWRCEGQPCAADPTTGKRLVAYCLRGDGSKPVRAQYVPVRFRKDVARRMINASFDGVRLMTCWEVI